jgi:hypothetical protein
LPVDSSIMIQDSADRMKPDSANIVIREQEIPPEMVLLKRVLSINPYFNFLGKRQFQLNQEHHSNQKDYLFYLISCILLYFGLIKVFYEKYTANLFRVFFRVSIRQHQIREQLMQTPLPSLLMNILFIISAGLYSCFILKYYHPGWDYNFPVLMAYCCGAITVLYLIKFAILKFCGWIFHISKATEAYIFIVFLVNKMLGILLIPFTIILAFSNNADLDQVIVTISAILVSILFIYRFSAGYRQIRNEIKLSIVHFFIYLCAFEITPLVLIFKVFLANLEKAF